MAKFEAGKLKALHIHLKKLSDVVKKHCGIKLSKVGEIQNKVTTTCTLFQKSQYKTYIKKHIKRYKNI